MAGELLLDRPADGVLRLTISNPVKRNALDQPILDAIAAVLSDIDSYEDLNARWRRQFPDRSTAPARFTFQAGALPFGAKIEIQAIAAGGS